LGGRGVPPAAGSTEFAVDASSAGAFTVGFLLVIAIETVVVHLLLRRWSVVAAYVLTAISVYSMFWLVGDFRAMGRLPLVLDGEQILVRTGLRFQAVIPLGEVRTVTLPSWREIPQRAPDYWNFARPGEPNVVLELAHATTVTMMFGLHRAASRVGVRLTEPERFRDAIASRIGERQ
jgi:hypothetical protein